MTLLEKCQKWHEAGQFPKIIDALEALGEDGRTKPNPRTRMPKNSWRTVSSA